ncbi:MAG: hypothetical protein IKY26_05605 [Erysipelotrichaceae bacterium]|nr:hypothetical protein [Erysipelotrichaceae bacterium]
MGEENMVDYHKKYDKYVDIVNNFVNSEHYSIMFETEGDEKPKALRYRLLAEFGDNYLIIRQRRNFVHVEKRVGYD